MAQIKTFRFAGCLTASTLLATVGILGGAGPAAVAAEPTSIDCVETAPAGKVRAGTVHQGASGLRAYVDPETGQLTEPPEGAQAEEPAAAALSTSDEGLAAVPSPVPGGGNVVDLQGRFRTPLVATIEADGKVRTQHATCPGNSTQRK